MNVLFHVYIPFTPKAAGIQQTIRVCYYLAKMGNAVSLHVCSWYFRNKEELLDFFGFENRDNFQVYLYSNPFKRIKKDKFHEAWGALFHLRRFFRLLFTSEKTKYDVFFARGYRFPSLHIGFKKILKYKIVLEEHEIIYLNNISEGRIFEIEKKVDFERYSYLNADGVIFISNSLRYLVERRWGKVPFVTVIPSGAMLFRSDPLPANRQLYKIYFIGNYYSFSGLDFVVRSLIKIPGATLTIVGGGDKGDPDYERIKALVQNLDLEERVHFKGFVQPKFLPDVYAESDILVLPLTNSIRARYFMSPLKLFEYMSARRPMVASSVPVLKEVLRDGENAILASPEDPDSIAESILKLMKNTSYALMLAENAYQDVKQYSMEKKCMSINNFLQNIVN